MANYMFDPHDDSRQMAIGVQYKDCEDRLFVQALATNGSEGVNIPSGLLDQLPGLIAGAWYDLGGSWNEQKHAWDLFGDCFSDLDYSCGAGGTGGRKPQSGSYGPPQPVRRR
ncbi:MAG: hypothetical protein QM811_32005 [Pirellulales bacterium]